MVFSMVSLVGPLFLTSLCQPVQDKNVEKVFEKASSGLDVKLTMVVRTETNRSVYNDRKSPDPEIPSDEKWFYQTSQESKGSTYAAISMFTIRLGSEKTPHTNDFAGQKNGKVGGYARAALSFGDDSDFPVLSLDSHERMKIELPPSEGVEKKSDRKPVEVEVKSNVDLKLKLIKGSRKDYEQGLPVELELTEESLFVFRKHQSDTMKKVIENMAQTIGSQIATKNSTPEEKAEAAKAIESFNAKVTTELTDDFELPRRMRYKRYGKIIASKSSLDVMLPQSESTATANVNIPKP